MIVAYYMLKQAEAESKKMNPPLSEKTRPKSKQEMSQPDTIKNPSCHRCGQYPTWCTCDIVVTI